MGCSPWGPGSVFVLNDVQDEFTGAHMACYGSDPSFNSLTFSWGSLTVRLTDLLVFHDADKFYVQRDHEGSWGQDWNDKGANKDCVSLPWCDSQAFNIALSIIFMYFHVFSWYRNKSLGPLCPAMSIQCRVAWFLTSVWAESNWYFPIASLYAHRTGESLCWRPHHRSKWHQQGLLLYTCWKDSETAAQVIFRCFVKYGDVVQFLHV